MLVKLLIYRSTNRIMAKLLVKFIYLKSHITSYCDSNAESMRQWRLILANILSAVKCDRFMM